MTTYFVLKALPLLLQRKKLLREDNRALNLYSRTMSTVERMLLVSSERIEIPHLTRYL